MRHANDLKFDLALVSRDWKKLNLNFCRLGNGLFLNLGATCFCSEWQARANRLQLPKAQDCKWATFPVALLQASPSSGILYTWTGSGKIVRTSMDWYVPVCTSTYQYTKSRPVHTGTYLYVRGTRHEGFSYTQAAI